MKRFYTFFTTLLFLMVAMPSMAQLDEVKDKILGVGDAATEIEAGKWYVMKNGGRAAYPYSTGTGSTLYAKSISDITLSGASTNDVCGYLVRFVPVEGETDAYYIQTGYGDYWNELTTGNNNGTVAEPEYYFVSGKIGDNEDWFSFVGNSGAMVLDCNEAGGTVAGWGTSLPTSTSSNAAWQILSTSFVEPGDILTATVNYSYLVNGEVVYTYTQTQKGVKPSMTVVFDDPVERYGATCEDETPADVDITEDKTFDVTYNYTFDTSNLPFKPTTIVGGKPAADTKWYRIAPYANKSGKYYSYVTSSDDNMYYKQREIDPSDLNYFFAFTGNPVAGFNIYSYNKPYPLSANVSAGTVTFAKESGTPFFLEQSYNYEGWSFTPQQDAYINAYSGEMTIYNDATWAFWDSGSRMKIYEVSEADMAVALMGHLTIDEENDISPASGTTFRDGEALDAVNLTFADESITIPAERKTITFQNSAGETILTPEYDLYEGALLITFDPEFNTEGTYTLIIPEGTVVGAESGKPNEELHLSYSFLAGFTEKTVTARIWKTLVNKTNGNTYTNWPYFEYPEHADGEYYTCKVKVSSMDSFTLMDWENNGDETDVLKMTFDTNKSTYNGISINDTKPSGSAEYIWISTQVLYDDGYSGAYFYPAYSHSTFDGSYGQTMMDFYSFADDAFYYVCADWYMDDRYQMDTKMGTVYNRAFTDLGYDNTYYAPFTQLPYGEDGTYNVTINNIADTLIIRKYDGINDLKLTAKNGFVTQVNNTDPDDYGTVWVKSSVLDGVSGGWYCYAGGQNSEANYNAETNEGYIVLSGYDYSVGTEGDYRYIYIGIGDYQPELDEPVSVKGDVNGDGAVDIADVNAVLTVMFSEEENYTEAADVNKDQVVDIADVNAVLSIMFAEE